jgi:hypothetical protein
MTMRHLPTLILSGILGSMILVGDARACHKIKCKCATPVVCAVAQPAPCVQKVACAKPKLTLCAKKSVCAKPAPCAKPVVCAKPAPCAKPVVATCAPTVKPCHFALPKLCFKKRATSIACAGPAVCTAAPVAYAVAAPVFYPVATPQH